MYNTLHKIVMLACFCLLSALALGVNVNFQPADSDVPPNYVVDAGEIFGLIGASCYHLHVLPQAEPVWIIQHDRPSL